MASSHRVVGGGPTTPTDTRSTRPAGDGATIDAGGVAAIDRSGMVDAILATPSHLRDGLHRADRAGLSFVECRAGLVVCAMGGSAIGTDLAIAALGEAAERPTRVVRDYRLGPGVGPETLVLAASYSGETEETLECFRAAERLGAPRAALTTGGELARRAAATGVPTIRLLEGLAPRAAVGYMLAGSLYSAERCGAARPGVRAQILQAADTLESRARDWGPSASDHTLPKDLARMLRGTVPVVYGAELTAPVARRWKCQLNENTKVPAFFAELPEACHNEICGWQPRRAGPLSAVFLDDAATRPRTRRRMELLAIEAEEAGVPVVTVGAHPGTRLERMMSLVMLGDLLSAYVAVLDGTDPTPVEQIRHLKRALGRHSVDGEGSNSY